MNKVKIMIKSALELIVSDVRQCTLCENNLPMGSRPVLQVSQNAKILIAAQAPGIRVHKSGIPFTDPSGDRLRQWLGVTKETFYDSEQIAILPMGFCYPGTGKSGDLPPRKECAKSWRQTILDNMPSVELILVMGIYAQAWHMKDSKKKNLTETVKAWRDYWPNHLPLPHPSPRNNIWIRKNEWFEENVVPELQSRVAELLS
jgi:uracil-DNA glycosylase